MREPRATVLDRIIEREPKKWPDGMERTKASVSGCGTGVSKERRTIEETFEINGVERGCFRLAAWSS